MAWYPEAVRKPLNKPGRPSMNPVRINLHTAVTNADSLFSYFSGNVAFSHFYMRKDGTVEQYFDTAYAARADLDGNPDTVSIETWDGHMSVWSNGQAVPAWTDAQVSALVKLVAWLWETHPSIPKRVASDSKVGPSSHGLSWHRIGIDGNFPALPDMRAGRLQRGGGMHYSQSTGKTCPGDARIGQIPGIFEAALAAAGGTPAPAPAPAPAPEPVKVWPLVKLWVDGDFGPVTKKAYQQFLKDHRYYSGMIDGDFGVMSVKAEQSWLKALGYYTGMVDGRRGLMTIKALQRFLVKRGLYVGVVDGIAGQMTVKGLQNYLNTFVK